MSPSLTILRFGWPAARAAFATLILFGSGAIGAANIALSGRVVDISGRPLERATITAHKLDGDPFAESSQTDSQGQYSLPELPDGAYSIEAAVVGFGSVTYKPVQIYFPAHVQRDFVLDVVDLNTEGGVYGSSQLVGELKRKGIRVAHANICLVRLDGPNRPACTTTNRLGQYFLDVPPDMYTLTVDGEGGLKSSQPLDMSTAGEYRNKITLADAR